MFILTGLTQNYEKTNHRGRREASALGGFPDLKQLARHGEIRVSESYCVSKSAKKNQTTLSNVKFN
jgi:hypothetical protein